MQKGMVFCTENLINWKLPNFSVLPRIEGVRIWSPPFYFNRQHLALIGHSWLLEIPRRYMGLIVSNNYTTEPEPLMKCFRFGITDDAGAEVNCCAGEWMDKHGSLPCGYFRVPKFTYKGRLTRRKNHHARINCKTCNKNKRKNRRSDDDIQFRLFCEVKGMQSTVGTTSTKAKGTCVVTSPFNCASISTTAEKWKCRRCTLLNPRNASNCEACFFPKFTGSKHQEASQNVDSAIGNHSAPTISIPMCIICFNKEREIVFQPCGHLITCSNCADTGLTCCPLCRKTITNKQKTFIV